MQNGSLVGVVVAIIFLSCFAAGTSWWYYQRVKRAVLGHQTYLRNRASDLEAGGEIPLRIWNHSRVRPTIENLGDQWVLVRKVNDGSRPPYLRHIKNGTIHNNGQTSLQSLRESLAEAQTDKGNKNPRQNKRGSQNNNWGQKKKRKPKKQGTQALRKRQDQQGKRCKCEDEKDKLAYETKEGSQSSKSQSDNSQSVHFSAESKAQSNQLRKKRQPRKNEFNSQSNGSRDNAADNNVSNNSNNGPQNNEWCSDTHQGSEFEGQNNEHEAQSSSNHQNTDYEGYQTNNGPNNEQDSKYEGWNGDNTQDRKWDNQVNNNSSGNNWDGYGPNTDDHLKDCQNGDEPPVPGQYPLSPTKDKFDREPW